MKQFSLFLFLFTGIVLKLYAQENGYFSQRADYKIDVVFKPQKREIQAFEQIDYYNNSKDTLRVVYIQLYANAYRDEFTVYAKNKLRRGESDFYFSDQEVRGYIDSLNFEVEGKRVLWQFYQNQWDVCELKLNNALLPGEKIKITTPFVLKLPGKIFSRSGVDENNIVYQITQWYPKPSVYDKQGWHIMHYSDFSEYYSDFGKFEVNIIMPKDFILASTGKAAKIDTDGELVTYQIKQDSIHDFAWFASAYWKVDSLDIVLPGTNKKVQLKTYYNLKSGKEWANALQYMHESIDSLTKWVGTYPYNEISIVQPGYILQNSMEYPTISLISDFGYDNQKLDMLIFHEIAHNWFYGILASNEYEEPWIDEGFVTYLHLRYLGQKYKEPYLGYEKLKSLLGLTDADISELEVMGIYKYLASMNQDLPANLKALDYDLFNYGGIVYYKTAIALNYLTSYLGKDVFDKSLRTLYSEFAFKHYDKNDIQTVFEKVSGKKLDWLFNQLIASNVKMDYAVEKVDLQKEASTMLVHIKRKAEYTGPFQIGVYRNDTLIYTHWIEGFEKESYLLGLPYLNADKVVIDPCRMGLEINRYNNYGYISRQSLLLPRLKLLTGFNTGQRKELYYLPLVGWNIYDKWMPGFMFYNVNIFAKKHEFFIAPLYSIVNNQLNGMAKYTKNWYRPFNAIDKIQFDLNIKRFSYWSHDWYLLLSPSILVKMGKKTILNPNRHQFLTKWVNVQESQMVMDDGVETNKKKVFDNHYLRLTYQWKNINVQSPHTFVAQAEIHKSYIKLIGDYTKQFMYNSRSGLQLRLFAGTFIKNVSNNGIYNFYLSGNRYDYTYNEVLLGRNELSGFLGHEFINDDGGFKMASAWSSHQWLVALNIESDLPGKLPIRLFADVGTHSNMKMTPFKNKFLVADAGFSIHLFNGLMDMYFPLLYTDDLKRMPINTNKTFVERMRFTLNLKKLNLFYNRDVLQEKIKIP